jgi:hypothetical protein
VAQLGDLMDQGYELLSTRQTAAACDRWLEGWEIVKRLLRPGISSTRAFDDAYPGLPEFVANWVQDLEMELGNVGGDAPAYAEHRVRYTREFLSLFPAEGELLQLNMGRAQGAALWDLGHRAEAEATYAALVERFPDDAWSYVGWADQYWLFKDSPKEYASAEPILRRALARPNLEDREAVLERLDELYGEWGKPEEQAAVMAQLEQLRGGGQQAQAESQGDRGGQNVAPAPPARSGGLPTPLPAHSGAPPLAPQGRQTIAARPVARPVSARPKPGRNAPCWCGSGKKYKRCHLDSDRKAGG